MSAGCLFLVSYCLWILAPWVLSLFSRVWLCATLLTVACQAPLSMGFSRQEYSSGWQCSPPGDLPNSKIEASSLTSPALAGEFLTISATWESRLHKDRNLCSSLDSYHLEQCLAHTRGSLIICWRKERRDISHRKPSWVLLRDKTPWFWFCGLLHFSLPQLLADWFVTVHWVVTVSLTRPWGQVGKTMWSTCIFSEVAPNWDRGAFMGGTHRASGLLAVLGSPRWTLL